MSQLRAHVYRDARHGTWHVDIDDPWSTATWSARRLSWAEAMQAAQVMLKDLDRFMMHTIYADRASRRP